MGKNVVVIAGPSGSGETTITNEIVRRFAGRVCRLVTATTRPPRAGEKDGTDYYFFTKERFEKEKESGNILESTYIENRDTHYGTYKPDLDKKLQAGSIVVINPDIVGARFYKKKYGATTIFILPESVDAIEGRLRQRNPEFSNADIAKRRANAEAEIENEKSFYDYVVTNADGKLNKAVDEVVAILEKEGYNLD